MSTIEEVAQAYVAEDAGFAFMLDKILVLNNGIKQLRAMVVERDKKIVELGKDLESSLSLIDDANRLNSDLMTQVDKLTRMIEELSNRENGTVCEPEPDPDDVGDRGTEPAVPPVDSVSTERSGPPFGHWPSYSDHPKQRMR